MTCCEHHEKSLCHPRCHRRTTGRVLLADRHITRTALKVRRISCVVAVPHQTETSHDQNYWPGKNHVKIDQRVGGGGGWRQQTTVHVSLFLLLSSFPFVSFFFFFFPLKKKKKQIGQAKLQSARKGTTSLSKGKISLHESTFVILNNDNINNNNNNNNNNG